jgi:ADP-heptose:LPS heptosyltransferase
LRKALRSCEYDAVIDLQGAVRSAVVADRRGRTARTGRSLAFLSDSADPWRARHRAGSGSGLGHCRR